MVPVDATFSFMSAVLAVILVSLVVYLVKRNGKSFNCQPPLYKGCLPWVGCAIEFGKSPLDFIERKGKELGSVYTLGVAGERLTFLTDPADFKHFFLSNNVDFQQGVQDAVKGVSSISPENFFKYHTVLHDTVKGRLASSRLGAVSKNLCQEFNQQLNGISKQGNVDLNILVRHTMYAAVMNNLFGKDIFPVNDEATFQKLVDCFVCFDDQFEYGARLPHFLLKDWKNSRSWLLNIFSDIVKKIYQQDEKQEDKMTLLESLLYHVDKSYAPNWGLMLLWASLANAIPITFWALIFILENEAIKEKLMTELQKVLPDTSGETLSVDEEDLAKVPYLRWCVLEAVRLRPVGIITRRVLKPFTVKGYSIPKGDMLMVSPYWSHRNEKYFPDPDTFKPERWADADLVKGNFLEGFIAFGGGRYMCPGRWFAQMEIQMYIALFLTKFNCSITGNVPSISTKHLVGTQQPSGSCMVHYERREPELID